MSVRSASWLAKRLTALAVGVGLFSTLSYGAGAHIVLRYLDPPLGAWWQGHEFWIMEGAASALGILMGVRIGARLVHDAALQGRIVGFSMILGALALAWMTRASAVLARLGWSADGPSLRSAIVRRAGYDAGLVLDKLLIAGVYFLKTAGFGLMLGMVLFGLTLAALFTTARADESAPEQAARS